MTAAGRPKAARSLAWGLWGVTAALTVAYPVLLILVAGQPLEIFAFPGAETINSIVSVSIGILVISRLPRHPIGWLLLVAGFFMGLNGSGSLYTIYAVFVAPALMATAAMNGAIYDSTFNLFYKIKYARTYEAILATPVGTTDVALGEITWALIRGSIYSTGFIVVMVALRLAASPTTILALPAAVLIGFTFASVGTAVTTFIKKWEDFDPRDVAWGARVKVGVVAENNLGVPVEVTFDQYTLSQPKK